jgi:hypothetical protein
VVASEVRELEFSSVLGRQRCEGCFNQSLLNTEEAFKLVVEDRRPNTVAFHRSSLDGYAVTVCGLLSAALNVRGLSVSAKSLGNVLARFALAAYQLVAVTVTERVERAKTMAVRTLCVHGRR